MSAGEACDGVATRSVFNGSTIYVFEPLLWTGQLLDTLRLQALGPFLMDQILMPIHTSCRSRDVVFIIYIYLSLFTENGSNYTVIAKQTAGLNKFNYTIMQLLYNA